MTNSRFASRTRPSLKIETAFVRYLALLVFVLGAVFTHVNAAITVNSTPQTDNDFCGTASPTLILPIVATSNCGAGTITYQWYVGSTFGTATAITAAGTPNYSGWNTSTLNVNNASALSGTTTYWAVATESSGACNDADTLGPFNYTEVNGNPVVTLTPSFDVCEGDDASFTATVTGPSPANILTYTWYRQPDGGSASVVQTTTDVTDLTDDYDYTTVLTDDQDDVYVEVTNACGTTTSSTSTVTVNPLPTVTVPSGMSTLSTCEGGNVNITYNISNAQYDPSSGGGNASWSIAFSGDAALIALLTTSGSGNTAVNLNVGATLSPGVYNATISTITNTSDGCPNTISTNAINVTVYPEPTITFSSTPSNICNGSGSGTSFDITVANAEYNNGGSTVAVNWQATITEASFAELTSCASGTAGLLGATYTGSGNGTFTFNIPTTMGVGIYEYTLTGITNTTNGCTGSVIGTSTVDWRVDPTPQVTVIPASNSVCEGNSNTFNINITNAEYCGTTAGIGVHSDVDWSLTYTDATLSTIGASPLTGTGEGIQGPYTTSAALTAGTYVFDPGTITVTTPAAPGCSRVISGNTYTLTVNPNPSVTFNTSSITQCEGTSGTTFSVDVTGAMLSGVGQNWSVSYTAAGASALSGTPCTAGSTAGIITGGLTGTGNGSTVFTIPDNLAPGYYTYTLNSITNTSAGCGTGAASVGANPTITIVIEPAPIITMNPDTKDVCENDAESFNLSITNTTGCSGIGTSSTADWTMTVNTDNVQSDVVTQIPGLTGTGNQTYTIGVNGLGTLSPDDHIFDASVVNSTGGTTCGAGSASRDTFTISVDPRPDVQINASSGNQTIDVCQGTAGAFSFVVTNAEHNSVGVNWEITYTESSGQVATNCNGLATVDLPGGSGTYTGNGNGTFTVTVPSTLPVGQYTYTLTNFVNTDGPCTGTVDGVTYGPQTITINVYPTPQFTVQPDSSDVCEGNIAFNDFSLVVTNARYCSTPSTITDVSWSISGITDNVASNAPNPITGTGNGATATYNSNTAGTLTAGSYTYTATIITTTGLSTNCPDTMTADTNHVLTVHPAPDASFTSATASVCEGDSGEVYVSITNAMLNGNPVNWSYTVTESSGNLTSSCNVDAAENASIVMSSTGSGNGTDTFSVPNNLTPGVYTYTITAVSNTDEGCTGTSATSTITIYVYPRLQVSVTPDDDEVCEGETANFNIDVTNARYCSALNSASVNVPWSLVYTDATQSNIFPDPLTGSGNSSYTFTANNGGLLTAGQYQFITSTITGQIVTPTAQNCPVSVPDTFTLTVNPEPVVTFSTASLTVCEGDTNTYSYTVSNAELLGNGLDWTVYFSADNGLVSNSCATGGGSTFTGTGNGDSTVLVGVPTNLTPGVYTFTIDSIKNTTSPCTGSIGAIGSITITVYPKPDVDLSADTLTVCENTTATFDLTVTNAEYCASIGGSLINVGWEITYTSNAQDNMPPSIWSGTGNMAATTYTVNAALGLTAGGSPYSIDIAQIENTTHNCTNADSFSGEELVVIVNDLPVLTIDSVTTNVCDGESATVRYSVSDVEATDSWSFTFSTDGGTTNHTVTGTGPVSMVDTFTVALTPPGIKVVSFTAITNTTTGCVGNTPSTFNVNVLTLPDVSGFANVSGTDICSGLDNDYSFTVTNSAGKNWTIWYRVGTTDTAMWTGTGNGTFTRTIPVQYHQDASGAFDARPLVIDSIGWTGGAGTPPYCKNTSVSDPNATLNVMPRPYITLVTDSNVCVNYTADVIYTVGGVRSSDVWDFDWYTTGPTDGPNNITGNGTMLTDTFTTLPLTPVGTSNVNVPTITNTTTGCDSSYGSEPWSLDIVVDPPTVAGTLTSSHTICDGDVGPFGFKLSGYTGAVQNWDSSDNDGFTWYDIGNQTDTHTVVSPHLTTRYQVVVKSGACPADTSNEVILFVHPQPSATLVSVDDSICENSNITVVFEVSGVPNTHGYEVGYSVSNGTTTSTGTWTGTGSSATITETLTNGGSGYPAGNWTVKLTSINNTNTSCDTTLNDSLTVKVKSNPVGSTASTANDTLCYQSSGFVRWDGTAADGYVVKWQKKTPSASTWTDIAGSAADSIEFIGLTQTTMFRAVIENAPCTGQAFSAAVTVTVLSTNPSAAWVGLPTNLKFCASPTTTTTLNYSVSGTNGNAWTLTILEAGTTHTVTGTGDVASAGFTTSAGSMLASFDVTLVKLVISSGSFTCTKNLDNTGIAQITVIDLPTVTLNSLTSEVCDGDSVTMNITVSDIKATENWELNYTIDGNAKTATGTGSGTFSILIPHTVSGGNATQTVTLTSIENTTTQSAAAANCTNTLTGVSDTYEAKSATVPGVLGTSISVCKGSSGFVTETTASTNGSVITEWMTRTWDTGTSTWSSWTSIGNTTTSQAYVNIQTNTEFKAVYQNSPCATAESNVVTITVKELPEGTIALASGSDTICEGSTATINLTVSNIDNGQTFTVYYVEGSVNKSQTFTNNATNTHSFTTGVITSTTDITLTKIETTSGTLCENSTLNSTVTVTVQEKPTATIASYDNVLCHGETVDFSVTVGNMGSTDAWTLTVTLDGNSETFTGTGTGTFSFTTTGTVTSTSDVLALTNIVNNSTQDACNTSLTESVTITVDPTTVAGVIGTAAISSDTIVCLGGSGFVKEFTAGTGNITKWQSRRNGTSTWVDINSTNSTQFFFNLTDTTEYRAVYQSGVCLTDFSNIVTATPKALPEAIISTVIDDSICAGETADIEITVTNVDVGSTFDVSYSEGSVNFVASFTQNASGIHTFTTSALTANTLVQLTNIEVTSTGSASIPACENTLSSNGTVTVLDLPFASITAGPDTLCQMDKIVFTVTVTNVLSTDNWSLRYELENDEDTITGTGPGSVTWIDTDPNTAESAKIQLIEILNLSNVGTCKSVNTDDWDIYIYKPTEPGDIVASEDTICKGGSTSIAEVTGTPKQGVTVSWEYKPISASNWTALNNNNTTLNILNLLETTDYRAVYKSGVCDTAHSNVVRIQVEELPLATLSGSTAICAGDSVDLTVTISNVGSTQDWELDYLAGTLFGQLTGTGAGTHTLRVGNFITNSDVILQELATVSGTPQCINDKLTNNAQARVNINERPYASLNSVVTPICQTFTSSFSFTVSNVRSGDDWTLTYEVDDATSAVTTTGKGPGTFTLATPSLVDAKTYKVNLISIVNNTTGCDSTLSSTMDIVVDATTTPGSVASDTTVCYADHVGTVTHTGGNGSIVRWETSIDGGTSWATISNTNSSYTYTNLTNTSLFRVVKKNGVCAEASTTPITVTVNELPTAVISGSDTICAGTSANLTVSVTNTQGEDWSVSYLVGTVLDTISVSGPLTTGTITTGSIKTNTDVTLKKVWMTSGTPQCQNDDLNNNATATVEVDDEPNATLISLTDSVCTGSMAAGKVNVTDVRTSEAWTVYWSINGGPADSVSGTGAGSFNFSTAALTVNPSVVRLTKIVNNTTGCEGSPTDQDFVIVSPETVGGTLAGSDTVCKDANSGTLTLGADAVGDVQRWEYSTDNGTTWTTINNTATTYSYVNLSGTTLFRVAVKSGACSEKYSSIATITVNELPLATIVTVGAPNICEGSSTFVALSITNVGAGMDWELTYLQGSSVKTLMGTGPGADTIWTGTLSATTSITLQSMKITSGSPQCENNNFTNNYTTTINVIDNPKATITSYPTDICKGETPTVTILVDNVLSTEAWTVIYQVNGGSNITSTGVGSGQFNLANMPQFNTEGANGVSLISITNTSSNPNCTGILSDSITINVDSTTLGGSISGVATVCKGGDGKLTLSGHRGSIVKWQASTDGINYYDIANTADTLNFTNLTVKTWYRVEVMNGVCDPEFSAVKTVDIQELPTVTINNPTIDICSGESVSLSLTIGNVSSTSTWSIDYTENGTPNTYSAGTGTNETITFGPYTSNTTIIITGITETNGLGCSNTISETAKVTVTPNPTATITTVPDSLCAGDIFVFTVSVDDVETGTDWELDYEIDGTAGPTKRGTGSGTFTVNTGRTVAANSVKVQLTEVTLDNALGCDTDLNDSAEVKVSPTTVGGSLAPSTTTICKGGSATLTLSGETGAIQNWEYSTDNGATWTVLSNNTNTVTINNINETTQYRVFVKSGTCTGAYSSVATVTVIPTPQATVTSNAKVCPGDVATFTLHISDVAATDGWSVVYTRNGVTVPTPVTGTGSGDFDFTVTGSAYTGNPTLITVELVSITNTTHGCVNNDLNSSASARVTPNPVAAFTADNSCEDSTVMFNNTSSIPEGTISNYKWYFGDGDSSVNGSPSHVYAVAGTYNVTLVAWSDNGCRGEVTQSITIHPNPTADFTFANVCKNETFSATDNSSVPSGNIVSWFWTFGDGTTSTAQNPTHNYAASGNYDVTLTVVTDNGCSNTVSKEVTVYILPEANFVASPVCEDEAMKFVNASAIGYGTMTYEWDFAGQGTSTDKDPEFTFTGFGTFSIRLIATSDNGCKDTIFRDVTVYPSPTADFTVDDVCIGDASVFVNASTVPGTDNIIEYFWDFGDANFSGLENPSHTYAAAGDYNVTLRVKSDKGCENSVTKVASVIALPDVDLTAQGPTEFCDGDSVVLTANANARSYDWTWDGGTSTAGSVTATTTGWYKVRITAPPIGCANEDSIFITVHALPVVDAWLRDDITKQIDTVDKGGSIEVHATAGYAAYLWTPNTYLNTDDMADVIAERVDDDITYTVTVTERHDDGVECQNSTTVTVIVRDAFNLVVYNTVTANGDGINDTWWIDNIWAYPEAEVIVFNRYGMEVFSGTGYANDWNATFNGKDLPDGPYYYVITHPDFPDTVYKGVINVIRETSK